MKFPKVLHVSIEKSKGEEPYLVAHTDGIIEIDDDRPVAIYKLEQIGRVNITKTFLKHS